MSRKAPGRGLRRPPRKQEASAEEVARFIEGNAPTTTNPPNVLNLPNVSDVQNVSDVSNAPGAVERADGRKLRRTTIYFEPEVYELLRKTARLSDTDISKLTNTILRERLPEVLQGALSQLTD